MISKGDELGNMCLGTLGHMDIFLCSFYNLENDHSLMAEWLQKHPRSVLVISG